ncbi:hypothetical protein JX266_013923 [Neoarthrinium moseri]|nr:hypothetical protein JX266_013923 [Neoarthrinium moseri]
MGHIAALGRVHLATREHKGRNETGEHHDTTQACLPEETELKQGPVQYTITKTRIQDGLAMGPTIQDDDYVFIRSSRSFEAVSYAEDENKGSDEEVAMWLHEIDHVVACKMELQREWYVATGFLHHTAG